MRLKENAEAITFNRFTVLPRNIQEIELNEIMQVFRNLDVMRPNARGHQKQWVAGNGVRCEKMPHKVSGTAAAHRSCAGAPPKKKPARESSLGRGQALR